MFPLPCNLTKNDVEVLPIEISSKKVRVNNMDFSARRNFVEKSMWETRGCFDQRNYVKRSTWKQPVFFNQWSYTKKSKWKQLGFLPSKLRQKSMWKQRGFFNHQRYIGKDMWKRFGYFDQRNYIEKVCGNDVENCWSLAFDVST